MFANFFRKILKTHPSRKRAARNCNIDMWTAHSVEITAFFCHLGFA